MGPRRALYFNGRHRNSIHYAVQRWRHGVSRYLLIAKNALSEDKLNREQLTFKRSATKRQKIMPIFKKTTAENYTGKISVFVHSINLFFLFDLSSANCIFVKKHCSTIGAIFCRIHNTL